VLSMTLINEAKKELLACTTRTQLMNYVEQYCQQAGFRFNPRQDLQENATHAEMQRRDRVAEVLKYAMMLERGL
jgi:hypothetical protein